MGDSVETALEQLVEHSEKLFGSCASPGRAAQDLASAALELLLLAGGFAPSRKLQQLLAERSVGPSPEQGRVEPEHRAKTALEVRRLRDVGNRAPVSAGWDVTEGLPPAEAPGNHHRFARTRWVVPTRQLALLRSTPPQHGPAQVGRFGTGLVLGLSGGAFHVGQALPWAGRAVEPPPHHMEWHR